MELALDDAVEGVIVEPAPPRTRVQLRDAAGVPVYTYYFPRSFTHWSLNLFSIMRDLGPGTIVWYIDAEEVP